MVNLTSHSGILGVVLLARHGDRVEFFQDPITYTPTATSLTALGTVQEYQLGSFLRNMYISSGSSSAVIGMSPNVADYDQVVVRADAAGEGATILQSVGALLRGLYPPTTDFNITLANGSTIVGADGGYQYITVESVEPNEDISLNSFTSCPTFDQHTTDFYNSPGFLQKATEAAPFLQALHPYIGAQRSIDFKNMFNIFDYVNVERIHNKTFLDALPPTFAEQAYHWANYHEAGVFSDGAIDGIGNIPIRTILPSIISSLQRIADTSDPLKLALSEISYKPFISLFNVTQATTKNPGLAGIVDYAAAVALELRASPAGPTVSMKFKNGTTAADFTSLKMFGKSEILLSDFITRLTPAAVSSTAQWCQVCNQHTLRGCASCSA